MFHLPFPEPMDPIGDYVDPTRGLTPKEEARRTRNRLSAQLHRKRKRDHIASLEDQLAAALARIAELEARLQD